MGWLDGVFKPKTVAPTATNVATTATDPAVAALERIAAAVEKMSGLQSPQPGPPPPVPNPPPPPPPPSDVPLWLQSPEGAEFLRRWNADGWHENPLDPPVPGKTAYAYQFIAYVWWSQNNLNVKNYFFGGDNAAMGRWAQWGSQL